MDEDWKDDPLEHTAPVRGSDDFLKDRGYKSPIEARIKFDLASAIRDTVEGAKLHPLEILKLVNEYDGAVDIRQPDVTRILRGNVKGYSVVCLMTVLAALGNDVAIVVNPLQQRRGQITVRQATATA